MMEDAASMWGKIGVKATVEVIDESEWMTLRKSGKLSCYAATWTADYHPRGCRMDPAVFANPLLCKG